MPARACIHMIAHSVLQVSARMCVCARACACMCLCVALHGPARGRVCCVSRRTPRRVYVQISACVCVFTFGFAASACGCVCLCMSVHSARASMCVCTHTHTYMYACARAHMSLCASAHLHDSMHAGAPYVPATLCGHAQVRRCGGTHPFDLADESEVLLLHASSNARRCGLGSGPTTNAMPPMVQHSPPPRGAPGPTGSCRSHSPSKPSFP